MLPSTLELQQALEYVRSYEADSGWSILGEPDPWAGNIWCLNMPYEQAIILDAYCEFMFHTRVRSVTTV